MNQKLDTELTVKNMHQFERDHAHDGTKACRWVDNDDYWQAECGLAWTLTADGPVENGMNFCPKCGRPLVVETAVTQQEKPE